MVRSSSVARIRRLVDRLFAAKGKLASRIKVFADASVSNRLSACARPVEPLQIQHR
jgi:hypothetical protein